MEALEYPILALSEVMSQNDQQKLLMGHGKLLYQLELHLNQINGLWGIEAASGHHFKKNLKDLKFAEKGLKGRHFHA